MRKGVEMSLNLIVTIVIVLIVAAIVIYLVAKNTSGANRDLNSCQAKGGTCGSSAEECRQEGKSSSSLFTEGCDKGEVCCLSQSEFLGGE